MIIGGIIIGLLIGGAIGFMIAAVLYNTNDKKDKR